MARKALIAAALVLASVASMPTYALAQRSRGVVAGGAFVGSSGRAVVGGRVVVGGGRAVVTPPIVVPPRFGHHPFFPRRPFFPFGVAAAAPIVYASPWYYPPPVYYPPPAYYPPAYYDSPSYTAPVSYAPPPSAPPVAAAQPTSNVVQFATGRYELRGDGVSTPYTWVWIPNPPTAPPPAAPTAPPTETPPATGPSSSKRPPATRTGQLYRWTDAEGVVYWTDRLDAVPEQYRSRAKHVTPS
jgi:hypothetical protein